MIAVPVVAGLLLLAHGLVHMLYLAPDMREFSTGRSRPASGPMPPSGALALMAATVAAFLVAALAVWGVPRLSGAWPALTVVACVLSVALLVAPSRHTQGRESRTACPGPGRWRLPSGRAVCPGVQDFTPCPRRGDRAKCGSMGVTAGPERLHVVDARAVLLIYGLSCVALGSEPVGHRMMSRRPRSASAQACDSGSAGPAS